ncbi:MAG: MotA/TolQ/ExbB proton channel family protein [Planctomycetes bacterium]|nr:MotA/TolQ/ExbB proton channel family protein [Planctomycetota bacterium]
MTALKCVSRRALGRAAGWLPVLAVLFVAPRSLMAADGEATSGETALEQAESFGQLIVKSGWTGWTFYAILALFSLAALTITLERLFRLTRHNVIPASFLTGLHREIVRADRRPDGFLQLCQTSSTPISKVLKAGALRAGRPLPEVEKSMEDAIAREMSSMRARNRPLNVIGSVAPLVGLLGTVVGMIFAFRTTSQAGLGKAELMAEGIYLALMTTAAGLSIAIPCLLLVAWFNSRAERLVREIDEQLLETMPCFARMETTGATIPNKEATEEARRQPVVVGSPN